MSRVLIGSMTSVTPAAAQASAAWRRLATKVSAGLRPVHAGGQEAGHAVEALAAQRLGVGEGGLDRARDLGLAAGEGGQAPLALVPVAGRHVEERLG